MDSPHIKDFEVQCREDTDSDEGSAEIPDEGDSGSYEDLASSIQDMISCHRSSPGTKKRERTLSPTSDTEGSPKRSLGDAQVEAGRVNVAQPEDAPFLLRAASRPSHAQALRLINGLHSREQDSETADLMAMIRGVETEADDDVDRRFSSEPVGGGPAVRGSRSGSSRAFSQITAELNKKFESNREPEEKKSRSSFDDLGGSSTHKPDARHDPDADLDLLTSHSDVELDNDPEQMSPTLSPPSLHDELMHVFHKQNAEPLEPRVDRSDHEDKGSDFEHSSPSASDSDSSPDDSEGENYCYEVQDEMEKSQGMLISDGTSGQEGASKDAFSDESEEIRGHSESYSERQSGVGSSSSDDEDQEEEEKGTKEAEPDVDLQQDSDNEESFPPPLDDTKSGPESPLESEQYSEAGEKTLNEDEANKESSLEGTNLDFSVLKGSQPLNHDVTKQRVSLRQKGSLAQRRRPTRNSIRSRSRTEYDKYRDSTEPKPQPHKRDYEEDERSAGDNDHTRDISGGRKDITTYTAPVPLPGLGDHIKRRTKDPKPIPKTFERPKPIENTSPSWMTEIKLRRGSRSSKVQQESSGAGPEIKEPDSPSWMKEVLTKKKRAADAMERRATQQVETEQPTVPPWMKELRRSNRSLIHPTSHNNGHQQTPDSPTTDSNISNFQPVSSIEMVHSPRYSVRQTRTREVLAPLQRSSDENSAQSTSNDNNRPIRQSNGHHTPETSRTHQVLPPIKPVTPPVEPHDDQENTGSPVPTWKKEIALRRKSKTHVPALKPESPMKLGETPAWKRELAERNKTKKRDSIDSQQSPSPSAPSESSGQLSPWQLELVNRRRRSAITRQPTLESPRFKSTDTPEWTRTVQQRRARLADSSASESSECGLIPGTLEESTG